MFFSILHILRSWSWHKLHIPESQDIWRYGPGLGRRGWLEDRSGDSPLAGGHTGSPWTSARPAARPVCCQRGQERSAGDKSAPQGPPGDDFFSNEDFWGTQGRQSGLGGGRSRCSWRRAPWGWSSPQSPRVSWPACCCWPPGTGGSRGYTPRLANRTTGSDWNKMERVRTQWSIVLFDFCVL